MDEVVNKVAGSGIVSIDLEEFHVPGKRVVFDVRQLLFQELVLKEKDFRDFIKTNNWAIYQDNLVAITCSADAIVPTWAYMLLALALEPYARRVFFGTLEEMEGLLFAEKINSINVSEYNQARIVIKGCGEKAVPVNAYVQITNLLKPVAKSIMYGEPCSTVPLYKAKAGATKKDP
jgi:hypothetical protein